MALFTKISKNQDELTTEPIKAFSTSNQNQSADDLVGNEKNNLSAQEESVNVLSKDNGWLDKENIEGQLTVDVYQTKDNIVIKSTIAGVRPEDIDISINNEMVTIRGSRKQEEAVKEDDYYYQECYWGDFSRSIILPTEVVAEEAEANLKNGVLTLVLPKARKSKSIAVKVRGE